MNLLNTLERKLGKLAIENITLYLIVGQVLVFLFTVVNPFSYNFFILNGILVLQGQYWRILSFLFVPITMDRFFAIFAWYLYYLYGTALEKSWGAFRYNLYIFVSFISTVVASFIFPQLTFTNFYLYSSIFLAFTYLFPDFRLNLFFILPIKIKWLGYLMWIGIFLGAFGSTANLILALISIANFLLFFGKELISKSKYKVTKSAKKTSEVVHKKAHHACAVCKRNELTDPDMDIRYCTDCDPVTCYCEKHIDNHEHLKK